MSIIYVASVGQTAALNRYYWDDAKEYFKYTESVIICGKNLVSKVSHFLDPNTNLVVIDNPFVGMEGYAKAVEDIVKQVLDIIVIYRKGGYDIDEVVINTAGGTEKMSCIIKDAVDIIKKIFPYVTHVWGATDGYKTRYTVKSSINAKDIIEKYQPRLTGEEPLSPQIIKPEPSKPVAQEETEPICKPKLRHKKSSPRKDVDPAVLAQERARNEKRKQAKEAKRHKLEQLRLERHRKRMEESQGYLAKIKHVARSLFAPSHEEKSPQPD